LIRRSRIKTKNSEREGGRKEEEKEEREEREREEGRNGVILSMALIVALELSSRHLFHDVVNA